MSAVHENGSFAELMAIRGGTPPSADELRITGADPLYASPFRIGKTSAGALAARGVAANDLWELRTRRGQTVSIDVRAADATSHYGGNMTLQRDEHGQYQPIPCSDAMEHMVLLTQPSQTAEGRSVLPHTNLPHLERRVLDVRDSRSTVESVRAGISRWNSDTLEEAVAEAKARAGKVRTPEEWLAHPHGA